MSSQSSDISFLEQQKENIQPLSSGRPASKLAATFKNSSRSVLQFKEQLKREREENELAISQIDELDDPLQAFVDYINWTHNRYPQGSNSESGLLNLLERCTSSFRDVAHYKNDPRYLKVWLEYTNYSDSPRDIFVYLAKKEIGNQLALYYEEFANYLEVNGKYNDASEIYGLGIASQARPLVRLERSYNNFKQRQEANNRSISTTNASSSSRSGLALKRGTDTIDHVPSGSSSRSKKPKMEVFREKDQDQSILQSIFYGESDGHELGSIRSRIKENVVNAKQWAGEVLRQKPLERESSSSSSRIQVYRDTENIVHPTIIPQAVQSIELDDNGLAYTLIKNPGKKPERVFFNMELLFVDNEEISVVEMLARSRKKTKEIEATVASTPRTPQISRTTRGPKAQEILIDDNGTFTIPLKDDDDLSLPINQNRSRSPTITMYSQMANHEVINMFNDASRGLNSDDEEEKTECENTTTTNFDGFVTETIQVNINTQPEAAAALEPVATPPTDKENDLQSSPFIEQPSFGSMKGQQIINPVDSQLRNTLLNRLSIPLSVYPGFFEDVTKKIARLRSFKDITDVTTKSIGKGSVSSIIDFLGEEIFCLRHELGRGGFGYVYLIESGSTGALKALKVESPSSKWEYYILHQIHRRLLGRSHDSKALIIQPEAIFFFKDESYMIMDYCAQGTILDVVNLFKNNSNSSVDEVLCIHLTIELLKAVEMLHSIGILHGDLKADNCMVRFEPLDSGDELSEKYHRDGRNGWSKKSITMIDFGRAIDLTLFEENVSFKCDWVTASQDCPQMNENKPWSFEADYYGLASIIHAILFGSYIKIRKYNGNEIKLENSLRRYWQQDLWLPLFDLLLNPYLDKSTNTETSDKRPLLSDLKSHRHKFEMWLEEHSKSKNLKKIVLDVERDLNITNKKRIN
ncbi:Mad3/BUB1 homology region 1-domain-containing protein [Scheffersomyces xylosifermentans]|uniref:Mad3/BUB1 homology region 1-domain-containing protein n=1 Tax=Scheffersomyces xylosifermentans TaxID=1304137 RepID=UPI00315D603C